MFKIVDGNLPKQIICCIAILTCLSGVVRGTPILGAGNIDLLPNTADQPVELTVSGAGQVTGFKLEAVIGNPTTLSPLGTVPFFDSIGYNTGPTTIWTPYSALTITGGPDGPSDPQLAQSSVEFTNTGTTISGTGAVATLYIDTMGFSAGQSFPLSLAGTLLGVDTQFIGAGGTNIPISVTNGTIMITPEPASIGVFALNVIGILFRRRHRKYRDHEHMW